MGELQITLGGEGGELLRGVAAASAEELATVGGSVRVIAVDATEVADDSRRMHGATGPAAELAAQGVVAAALLSAHIKGEERLTVQIQASRPALSFFGEIDAEGGARSRISPNTARPGPGGRMDGILLAIKADAEREMYRGLTEIADQTLEEALEHHLRVSSQIDAVLRIEARATDEAVERAVGVLIERLPEEPGKPSMDRTTFEQRYRGLPAGEAYALYQALNQARLLDDEFRLLEARPVYWRCRCSQGKVEATLASLGPDMLREMADEDHGAEVVCHFCNSTYQVDEPTLRAMILA